MSHISIKTGIINELQIEIIFSIFHFKMIESTKDTRETKFKFASPLSLFREVSFSRMLKQRFLIFVSAIVMKSINTNKQNNLYFLSF